MQRVDLLEKTLMLGKTEGRREWQKLRWLDGITDPMDMSLNELQEMVKYREACHAAVMGSQRAGLQYARLLCPSLSPKVCSNSCPLHQRCYLTIVSSAASPSFAFNLPQHQGFFPVSQLFTSGGQSVGAWALAPVLLMNIQGWFPFDLHAVQETLNSLLQHNSKASVL